jgi:transposase
VPRDAVCGGGALGDPVLARVAAIRGRDVDLALREADFSEVARLAVDETSRAKGHDYLTLFADPDEGKVFFVAEGRGANTVETFADDLVVHGGDPAAIESVSIDMSPVFIKGVGESPPNVRVTIDKFHVVAHASQAVGKTRRIEQKSDAALKGLRWTLLKDRDSLGQRAQADPDALLAQVIAKRTARAWLCREQLRDILDRKQINVVRGMLSQCCTNVMRSKVEPMKDVAKFDPQPHGGHRRLDTNVADQRPPRSLKGLLQAAKRKAA